MVYTIYILFTLTINIRLFNLTYFLDNVHGHSNISNADRWRWRQVRRIPLQRGIEPADRATVSASQSPAQRRAAARARSAPALCAEQCYPIAKTDYIRLINYENKFLYQRNTLFYFWKVNNIFFSINQFYKLKAT